jgi:hypothetical protein
MHSWITFGARMNHGHTWTHKTHHGPNLGEATTFPLILFSVISHKGCTQMSFCLGIPKLGVPKFSKLGLLELWRPINSCADPQLRWGLNQSYNSHQDLSNNMWHATCTHVFQGDSQILMVRSQIGTLILGLSFGHNLCFKYSNGSCEPILDIYISRYFQWYKKLFNFNEFWPLKFFFEDSRLLKDYNVGVQENKQD